MLLYSTFQKAIFPAACNYWYSQGRIATSHSRAVQVSFTCLLSEVVYLPFPLTGPPVCVYCAWLLKHWHCFSLTGQCTVTKVNTSTVCDYNNICNKSGELSLSVLLLLLFQLAFGLIVHFISFHFIMLWILALSGIDRYVLMSPWCEKC